MNHSQIVSFIWGVADLIRDTFKRGKYQDVILPLTVLRRLDCVLSPTKRKVLEAEGRLKGKLDNLDPQLRRAAGFAFYNTSPYDFEKLLADAPHVAQNLRHYIAGFSPNMREVLPRRSGRCGSAGTARGAACARRPGSSRGTAGAALRLRALPRPLRRGPRAGIRDHRARRAEDPLPAVQPGPLRRRLKPAGPAHPHGLPHRLPVGADLGPRQRARPGPPVHPRGRSRGRPRPQDRQALPQYVATRFES